MRLLRLDGGGQHSVLFRGVTGLTSWMFLLADFV
jgi:hypothetical protein